MFHHRIVKNFIDFNGDDSAIYEYNIISLSTKLVILDKWQDSPQACIGALELIKTDCIAHYSEIEEIK